MGSHSRVSRPSTSTVPDCGSSSRLTSFKSVLFPAPLRPTSANTSPRVMPREKRSRIGAPAARVNVTSRNSRAASGIRLAKVPLLDLAANRRRSQQEDTPMGDMKQGNQGQGQQGQGQGQQGQGQQGQGQGQGNQTTNREPAEG